MNARVRPLLLIVLLCLLLPSCRRPSFNNVISPEQEDTIGDWAAAQIQSEAIGPVDPDVIAEVDAVTKRLNVVFPLPKPPRILISDTDAYTVTSLPGEWIVISSETVTLFANQPDALAGLLAHEYAHVEHDDAMDEMTDALGPDSMLDMTTQGKYTETSNIAVQLMNFGHTPDVEAMADAEGVRLAASAGYDPHGILTAIDVLQKITPVTDAEWLVVHPVNSKRIGQLIADIANQNTNRKVSPNGG
jgi:predicted Zn-dependent protease